MAAGPSVAVDGHFGHRRRPWAGTTAALAATQEARRAVGGAILVGPPPRPRHPAALVGRRSTRCGTCLWRCEPAINYNL